MRALLIATFLAWTTLCHASPIERAVLETARRASVSADEVRLDYDACGSGATHSMTICTLYQLVVEELRLGDSYDALLKTTRGAHAERELAASQRAWSAYRDAVCDYETEGYVGGSIHAMNVNSCRAALTADRVKRLDLYLHCEGPGCPASWWR